MSRTTAEEGVTAVEGSKKRTAEDAELEIDINAPEPPSKKALRKAKKSKVGQDDNTQSATTSDKTNGQAKNSEDSALDGQDGKRSEFGIWIGNLSFLTTKQDVLTHLTNDLQHVIRKDQITRIHLPMSPERKLQNKGFAYVDFDSQEAVKVALELSETLLGGRRVLIKDAKNFEGRPKAPKGEPEIQGKPPSKRIFIGNLGFETTVEQLEEHFGVCGTILDTKLATFEDSGKCKGYAWVEFEQLPSAEAAMRGWVEVSRTGGGKQRTWLKSIEGRKLRMEFAEDKTTRYNKRFGKNAKADDGTPVEKGAREEQAEGIVELPDNARPSKPSRENRKEGDRNSKFKAGKNSRYGTETVQKLTGAIVEGQGKKMTFD